MNITNADKRAAERIDRHVEHYCDSMYKIKGETHPLKIASIIATEMQAERQAAKELAEASEMSLSHVSPQASRGRILLSQALAKYKEATK